MKLKIVDWEKSYDPKKVVRNPEALVAKTKTFAKDGIFSEEIFGNLNESHSFSCGCGRLRGKFYLGFVCSECGGRVALTESAVGRVGWVDLGKARIIGPLFYNLMARVVGRKNLDNIVAFNKRLDVDGNLTDAEDAEDDPRHPWANSGLVRFRKEWPEVLRHYAGDNEVKARIVSFLERNRRKMWVRRIPVIPTILRPAVMIRESLVFDEINNLYNSLIATARHVEDALRVERRSDLDVPPMLASLQATANRIFDKVLDSIRGKHGHIRSSIMGSTPLLM